MIDVRRDLVWQSLWATWQILFSNSGSGCQAFQRYPCWAHCSLRGRGKPSACWRKVTLAVQCCKGRPFGALAKNRTNSPSPSCRQGRLFPPFSRISVFYLPGSNLLLRPVELGPVDPHAMQNDCELARDRDLGLAEPVALDELHPQDCKPPRR